MENSKYRSYLDIIRCSVSSEDKLPQCKIDDWSDFLSFCSRQGIVGIIFNLISRLDVRMNQEILFEWIALSESIKQQNSIINSCQTEITKCFNGYGYNCCILKGQANGLMYPYPSLRTSGDIDVWVEGAAIDLIKMVRKHVPDAHYCYHHIEFPTRKGVMVEVHYTPIHLNNWITDIKLQRYINHVKNKQFSNKLEVGGQELYCLTREFNAVYLMLHMYGHFFTTRNNFKQLTDYYYLLKGGFDANQKEEIQNRMKEFGLLKFASGIMWIMQAVFGIDSKLLLTIPDNKLGRKMLKENLHYNEMRSKSRIGMLICFITTNKKFLKEFPAQIMLLPVYMLWHQWWKVSMAIKLNRNK